MKIFNFKRIISIVLVVAITAIGFLSPLDKERVYAAASKKKYIKDVRLYITTGSVEDAKKWCEKQNKDDGDWHVIEQNMIEGYQSSFNNSPHRTYFCYQTTDDYHEAITDLAVMNEYGNYDVSAYSIFLEQQRETFIDMVNDLKDMLAEYRINYGNKVETAVQAHDILNGYKEDDSGKLLGDFLLEADEDALVEVFLQANGRVVMIIEEELAYASDTKNTTWLERMEKLGSYDALRKKALKSYNNNAQKADKFLEANYKEKAQSISIYWDDIKSHIDNCNKFMERYRFADMTEEEIAKWFENREITDEIVVFEQEYQVFTVLAGYSYDGGTLLDYFNQPYKLISGKNLYKLYPLVASLTAGQKAAVNQEVSLFSLVRDAISSNYYNELDTDLSNDIQEALEEGENNDDKSDTDTGEEVSMSDVYEETEELNELVDAWTERDPISVYEGIDREIFNDDGGIAITTTAENYGRGAQAGNWTDSFVDSYKIALTNGGLIAGSILGITAAALASKARLNVVYDSMVDVFETVNKSHINGTMGLNRETVALIKNNDSLESLIRGTYSEVSFREQRIAFSDALDDICDRALSTPETAAKFTMWTRIKIGFTVFAVIVAIVDIAITVTALCEYYNRDHGPIPHHMVDVSYNENKETSYVAYRVVRNQKNEIEDMYANEGKQWLAMYYTKDEDAGKPLLAPDEDNNSLVMQYGKNDIPSGYSPLHIFGTPNGAQNLTVSGGANGWSFNDKSKGCYFFYMRDENAGTNEIVAGTALSRGRLALLIGIGLLSGLVLGTGSGIALGKGIKKKKTANS